MPGEKIVKLTDGSTLEVKVNFATLYYIEQDSRMQKLMKKKEKLTDKESMETAARLIHVILRSNGRNVTFDEALILTPIDEDDLGTLFSEFEKRLERYKKKEQAKNAMNQRGK